MTNPNRRLSILAAVALVGAGLSAYLSHHFYQVRTGTAGFKSFCNINDAMNCDVIAASPYAELVGGLPISSFSAGWFLAILAVAMIARMPHWRRDAVRALLLLSGAGTLISLVYLFIMASVLNTLCLLCLGVDLASVAALAIAISLKPEGLKVHRPDFSKWKILSVTTASTLVISVLSLSAFDVPGPKNFTTQELVNYVLSHAPVDTQVNADLPSIGPVDAPITVVEFSDFQCPHCRQGALTINTLMNRFPGKIRVVLRNFPLDSSCNRSMHRPGHPAACEAAKAALCAKQQGKFIALYEEMFENQQKLSSGVPTEFAKRVGTDMARFESCMSAPETQSALAQDIETGLLLGVASTPTFFINGRKMEGVFPLPVWVEIIERLLAGSK